MKIVCFGSAFTSYLALAALLVAVAAQLSFVGAFEDFVPTQVSPIGLVRDPQNDCIYVIFRRQIRLACSNSTFADVLVVISEKELGGNPVVQWVDRLDASGYLIFSVQRADIASAPCSMYATKFARTRGSSTRNDRFSSVHPNLAINCAGWGGKISQSVLLSPNDNQAIYFMGSNMDMPSQSGLYTTSIPSAISSSDITPSPLKQLPAVITPSFAFIAPDFIAFRSSNGSISRLNYHQMNTNVVVTLGEEYPDFYPSVSPFLLGPFVLCGSTSFSWFSMSFSAGGDLIARVFTRDLQINSTLQEGTDYSLTIGDEIIDFAAYNCKLIIAGWNDGDTRPFAYMDFLGRPITKMNTTTTSRLDITLLQGSPSAPPVLVARDPTTFRLQYLGFALQANSSIGPGAVTAAGRFMFSVERMTTLTRFGLYAYPVDSIGTRVNMANVSTVALCPADLGYISSLSALEINSTVYAVVLPRPSGTMLEYHSIDAAFPYQSRLVGFPIALFPNYQSSSAPYSITGSSVVQLVNETHLLMSLTSTTTPSIPAIKSYDSSRAVFTRSGLSCLSNLSVRSALFDPTGTRAIFLFTSTAGDAGFARVNMRQLNISTALAYQGGDLTIVSSIFSGTRPGNFPGFSFVDSDTVFATSGSAYQGLTFNGESTTPSSSSTFLTAPTSAWVFAVGKGTNRTLVYSCASNQICAADLTIIGVLSTTPNTYPATQDIRILALDSGNFVAFAVGQADFYTFSKSSGWILRPTSGGVMTAAVTLPGTDEYLILLKMSSISYQMQHLTTLGAQISDAANFTCNFCVSFAFGPVSTSRKLIFTYYEPFSGPVIEYIALNSSGIVRQMLLSAEANDLNAVTFCAGDTYAMMFDLGMMIVRLGAEATIRMIPHDFMLNSLTYSGLLPLRLSSGGYRFVTTVTERLSSSILPLSRVVVLDPIICRIDQDCPPSLTCDGLVCAAAAPVQAAPPPPLASTCPLPAPFGAICLNGVYKVNENATSVGQVVVGAPVVINGSLTLGTTGSIVIQNNASIVVSGCITIGGDLVIKIPVQGLQASDNITVIEFGGGYCGGQSGAFNSTTVVSDGSPPCAQIQSTVGYGQRSISVLYRYDVSGCAPNDASLQGLTVGAIVGIAVGATALVAIILATIFIARFRRAALPYDARRKKENTNQHELD